MPIVLIVMQASSRNAHPAQTLWRNAVPKSKVRKKPSTVSTRRPTSQTSATASAARVKIAGPSSPVYIGVMIGLMVLGLLWLVVNYLWGQAGPNGTGGIPVMRELGSWNFAIGFALMIAGLLMTMRWR